MNNILQFYNNFYSLKNTTNCFLSDIISWDDYNLETNNAYIYWLFPYEIDSDKSKAPNLTKDDIKTFRTDVIIRSNVVDASLRMLLFYGFVLDGKDTVKQIKPLNRRDRGKTIGLFSVKNYKRLTRIMDFLVLIDMEYLSALFFLALCKSIKSNKILLKKVLKNNSLKIWMSTQNYLVSKVSTYDVENLSNTIVSREKDYRWDVNFSDSEEEIYNSPKKIYPCVYGLNFTSNSCYMDSSLLCTFAIPNETINKQILQKDLNSLKNNKTLDIKCSSNINKDIISRKQIQKALVNITKSMRGINNVKNCTNLRKLFSKCPGPQSFHNGGTQDAGEFVTYLFNIFQVENATERKKFYGTNKEDWKFIRKQKVSISPIITIGPYELSLLEGLDITSVVNKEEVTIFSESNYWKVSPNTTYMKKKEKTSIDAPILIFKLERRDDQEEVMETSVLIPETLKLKKRILNLSSMVVHNGGAHYTANIKCGGNWWFYDDNPAGSKHNMIYLGSYKNMLNNKYNEPDTLGTLFFYT
jgi:ubiquitin C-terminal hydrolase